MIAKSKELQEAQDHMHLLPFIKEVLSNKQLSWKAKGLLFHIFYQPGEKDVCIDNLVEAGPGGRRTVQSAIQELKRHGYARLRRKRKENGIAAGTTWDFVVSPNKWV